MPVNFNNAQLNENHLTKALDNEIEIEKAKLAQGFIGRILGNSVHSPNNIAAITVIGAFLVGLIYTWIAIDKPADKLSFSVKDCWMAIIPVITLSLGFIFGVNNRESSEN